MGELGKGGGGSWLSDNVAIACKSPKQEEQKAARTHLIDLWGTRDLRQPLLLHGFLQLCLPRGLGLQVQSHSVRDGLATRGLHSQGTTGLVDLGRSQKSQLGMCSRETRTGK